MSRMANEYRPAGLRDNDLQPDSWMANDFGER